MLKENDLVSSEETMTLEQRRAFLRLPLASGGESLPNRPKTRQATTRWNRASKNAKLGRAVTLSSTSRQPSRLPTGCCLSHSAFAYRLQKPERGDIWLVSFD